MNEMLFVYLGLGIALVGLTFVILLGWHQRATQREVFDPWNRAFVDRNRELCDFYYLVARTVNRDFTPFKKFPWVWFRYRNLLRARKLL